MEVRFLKTHKDAQLPKSAHENDTGYDLYSVDDIIIPHNGSAIVPTGISVSYITSGYWFLILPRSGLGFKKGIQPHLGTIDNGYQGDLGVKLYNFSDTDYEVHKGDRVAQIAFFPLTLAYMSWTSDIEQTDRGGEGFGSSGK